MQTFTDFVQQLAHIDDNLFPHILFGDTDEQPHSREALVIFVGTGSWKTSNEQPVNLSGERRFPFIPVDASCKRIVLNHKGMPEPQYTFDSVTDFVLAAPDEVVSSWRSQLPGFSQGIPNLANITLIVDDASPDTCFALCVFLARVAQISTFPQTWVNYIRQWELGDVHSTGDYPKSWAGLQSALAHSYFSVEDTKLVKSEDFKLAIRASIRLLVTALSANIQPYNLPSNLSSIELTRARALQHYELQIYAQSLQSATLLELSLPMEQSKRKVLISAYIAKEAFPLGALKMLARKDPNTWDGQGYALMALYRPYAAGSGNDIVISVDPSRGVWLKSLWEELEKLEDQKWGGERPRDNPRRIKSYMNENGVTKENAPNQPWWDDHGRYTLIAAPKSLENASRLGYSLTWNDVINTLFELYNPVKDMLFRARIENCDEQTVDINQLRQNVLEKSTKKQTFRFIVAHWPDQSGEAYLLCDTVWRYFAACIKYPKDKIIAPGDLPKKDSYELVHLPGGTVLIHTYGIFALDDWDTDQLNVAEIKNEFVRVSSLIETLEIFQQELGELLANSHNMRTRMKLLGDMRSKLLDIQMEQQTHSELPDLKPLRISMDRRFSIKQKIADIHQNISELHEHYVSRVTAKNSRMIEYFSIFGFPALLFAGFFQKVFENVQWIHDLNLFGIDIDGLIAYLTLTFISILSIFFIIRAMEKKDTSTSNEAQNTPTHSPQNWDNDL